MPIETAPKDGAWFLTWRMLHGHPDIATAHWADFVGKKAICGVGWAFAEHTNFPTHWMPLPPAPGAAPPPSVQPLPPAIPEGWKLVPIEPTPAICAAMVGLVPQLQSIWTTLPGVKWHGTAAGDTNHELGKRNCAALYAAMLSASPCLPLPQGDAPTPQALRHLAARQEPLGAEFEKVLMDNLPALYCRDGAAPPAAPVVLPRLTDERITAAFQKYGTGRPDGFAAAVRAIESELRSTASSPPSELVKEAKSRPDNGLFDRLWRETEGENVHYRAFAWALLKHLSATVGATEGGA
jgi:hypothetical protein